MISPTFFNFDAAGNTLPTENAENNSGEPNFATFFDQMFVYPTNASIPFQNSAPNADSKEMIPICIKSANTNLPQNGNAVQRFLPNPMETTGETTIETPPILEFPQNPLPNPATIAKDLKTPTVQTPPILPEQTTSPVETPPIFEQTEIDKPVITPSNTQKPVIKNETPIETPPIIVQPTNQNPPPKTVTLNPNTKRVETNVEETPPIVVLPENGDSKPEKELSTTKTHYLNSVGKPENNTAKVETNISKPLNNIAKNEMNTARSEINNQRPENAPPISMNTSRAEENPPQIDMVQQTLNLSKMTGKIVRREFPQNVNATVNSGNDKDYTPILIPNEIGSIDYSVKTENFQPNAEKSSKLENILFNLIAPKSAETTETAEQKGFGNISLEEFQINETPKNSKVAKFETEFSAAKTGETAEISEEVNAELFTKSVFPKRKDFATAYEATNQIRGEENQLKFELPLTEKTPNLVEKMNVTEQVETQMTELAAKVEQTKETQILKMRLHPAELGTVEIHLEKNAKGHLQAHFSTETETARTALHENIDQLRTTLEKAGWQVNAVEVSSSTTSTTHYNGNQQNADSEQNNYYQSFTSKENANELSQTEANEKDELSHIVSLRA